MEEADRLITEVAQARHRFLDATSGLDAEQARFKPAPSRWSILEITEHVVRAEDAGVSGLWHALEGWRRGELLWSGEPVHKGRSIEQVIARTWQPEEQAPEVALPRRGGALAYWRAMLRSRQAVLEELGACLPGVTLEEVIYPHPISGPLDARQRLALLGFHLDHHRAQVEALKRGGGFPQ